MCDRIRVGIAKSNSAVEAVEKAVNIVGGIERAVSRHASVVIKPNLCGGVPGERGSHTSLAVIEALLQQLAPLKKTVYMGEADGSCNWPDEVCSALGMYELAKRYGARVVNLSTGPAVEVAVAQPLSLKTVRVARVLMESSETCITGMLLAMLAHLRVEDERLDRMAEHLLGQQMADGGWNCETYRGATHASFHTTLSVLEGLEGYRKFRLDSPGGKGQELAEVEADRARGHEFLLWHNLFRSHRTGEVFDGRMLRFPFPPRYRYDVLRALDYFQGVKVTNASVNAHNHIIEKDARFEDAIALLRKKRRPDGRWDMYAGMSGRIYFELEKAGQPSLWNTLHGLLVLKWWEALR